MSSLGSRCDLPLGPDYPDSRAKGDPRAETEAHGHPGAHRVSCPDHHSGIPHRGSDHRGDPDEMKDDPRVFQRFQAFHSPLERTYDPSLLQGGAVPREEGW